MLPRQALTKQFLSNSLVSPNQQAQVRNYRLAPTVLIEGEVLFNKTRAHRNTCNCHIILETMIRQSNTKFKFIAQIRYDTQIHFVNWCGISTNAVENNVKSWQPLVLMMFTASSISTKTSHTSRHNYRFARFRYILKSR